ncbi:akuammiline synthase 2-like [Castanea sativa]|uniref:akuammiline synthase 2-like n=1 Tax=Castanea sativa TaxID=21020 RepID=UPI003F650ADB
MSKETIKLLSPTPDHLRHYKLFFLDQSAPHLFMPWVLYYPKDLNAKFNNLEQHKRIKKSLSKALTQFYLLAGCVKHSLYIKCNGVGVPYVEAVAKFELSEFLENPNSSEHNKFLPYQLHNVNDLIGAVQVEKLSYAREKKSRVNVSEKILFNSMI